MCVTLLGIAAVGQVPALGQSDWPQEFDHGDAHITVYQPQFDRLDGVDVEGRAAMALKLPGRDDDLYGVVTFSALLDIDRDQRSAGLSDIQIAHVEFANATDETEEKLARIVQDHFRDRDIDCSLDELLAGLDGAELVGKAGSDYENVPPQIRFVDHPAVLVTIDGEPALRELPDSNLLQVVNTPFLILQDQTNRTWYLHGESGWYHAPTVQGPWRPDSSPPPEIARRLEDDHEETPAAGPAAEVIVATEPTELIESDGPLRFEPIEETSLLYATNTDDEVFRDTGGRLYVLLAGRWYRSEGMKGPWEYVPADRLPEDFARIPVDSDAGEVLAFVAGTPQAEDAVEDTYVAQTATIDRDAAHLDIDYDGDPQFEPINGTPLEFAVNTPYVVIRVDSDHYYSCDQGVWFMSGSPLGGWRVCDDVPDIIYTIPPSSPCYPVTYCRVYESTPAYVRFGYTPGYVGCYVENGTVIYGTGYHYRGWLGRYYVPRPRTWGFAAAYNPLTSNWGFRIGRTRARGWIGFGLRDGVFRHGGWAVHDHGRGWSSGWWGPGGFRHVDADRNIRFEHEERRGPARVDHVNRLNVYNRRTVSPWLSRAARERHESIARRTDERSHRELPDWRDGARVREAARTRTLERNNVIADRDGNIIRRSGEGWERRTREGWRAFEPSSVSRPERTISRPVPVSPTPPARPVPERRVAPEVRPRPEGRTTSDVRSGARRSRPAPQTQVRPARPITPQHVLDSRVRGATRSQRFQGYHQAEPSSGRGKVIQKRPAAGRDGGKD